MEVVFTNSFRLRVPCVNKNTRKKESGNPPLGKGSTSGLSVPSGSLTEKRECISIFAGSFADNVSVSAFSLVPSQNMRASQRFRWFPLEGSERIRKRCKRDGEGILKGF